jgi:hypothetical protein
MNYWLAKKSIKVQTVEKLDPKVYENCYLVTMSNCRKYHVYSHKRNGNFTCTRRMGIKTNAPLSTVGIEIALAKKAVKEFFVSSGWITD